MPVVRRFPLALAKDLQFHRPRLLVNLDMDLSAFAVVLGFGPDQLRVRKKVQCPSASCSLDGLRNLGVYGRLRLNSSHVHGHDTNRPLT